MEGWIDPHMFHGALKNKAIELGAEFVKGEVKNISEIKAKNYYFSSRLCNKRIIERHTCSSSETYCL